MDVEALRTIADRCRALARVAVKDEIRTQLRQWAEEFDDAADEKARDGRLIRSAAARRTDCD